MDPHITVSLHYTETVHPGTDDRCAIETAVVAQIRKIIETGYLHGQPIEITVSIGDVQKTTTGPIIKPTIRTDGRREKQENALRDFLLANPTMNDKNITRACNWASSYLSRFKKDLFLGRKMFTNLENAVKEGKVQCPAETLEILRKIANERYTSR